MGVIMIIIIIIIIIITIIIITHKFQFCRYLREAPGEHTYLPISQGKQEFFRWKLSEIRMFLYCKNKARGDIFETKSISEKFC